MLAFLARKGLQIIPVGIGVVTIVALLIHMVPGDPLDTILGDYATASEREAMRQALGLDRSLLGQLGSYFVGLLRGDLGLSLLYNDPVAELMAERIPATIELALAAILVAAAIGIPLGLIAALHRTGTWDSATLVLSLIGVALPNFWLGPMLVLVFALGLEWFPVSERNGFAALVLPAITMGTALAAIICRMTRNAVLDVLQADFVRFARAKGCREWIVITKHVLRNASIPIATVIGLQFGVLLTGAVVTEKIFDWPGLGSLILEALGNRDYPLVQGCVLLFSFTYMAVNVLTDALYALLDPRIQVE